MKKIYLIVSKLGKNRVFRIFLRIIKILFYSSIFTLN